MCSPFYYSESELIKAYSQGYEHGHHDTVEGVFSGNGHPEEHDELAEEQVTEMLKEGAFKRRLNLREEQPDETT